MESYKSKKWLIEQFLNKKGASVDEIFEILEDLNLLEDTHIDNLVEILYQNHKVDDILEEIREKIGDFDIASRLDNDTMLNVLDGTWNLEEYVEDKIEDYLRENNLDKDDDDDSVSEFEEVSILTENKADLQTPDEIWKKMADMFDIPSYYDTKAMSDAVDKLRGMLTKSNYNLTGGEI